MYIWLDFSHVLYSFKWLFVLINTDLLFIVSSLDGLQKVIFHIFIYSVHILYIQDAFTLIVILSLLNMRTKDREQFTKIHLFIQLFQFTKRIEKS